MGHGKSGDIHDNLVVHRSVILDGIGDVLRYDHDPLTTRPARRGRRIDERSPARGGHIPRINSYFP